MSDFHQAFARFERKPTHVSLGTFAFEMERLSTIARQEDMKEWLMKVLGDIRKKEEYDGIRADDGVLRLYHLLTKVSRQLGPLGIYEQVEKDGSFVNSLKFHLQWATELAKRTDMTGFERVLCLARDRLKKKMSISEIEQGFRDLAEKYLKDDFHRLFEVCNKRNDSQEVQFAKEAVENHMGQKRKNQGLSVVEKNEDDIHDKKPRILSPLVKTDNANRVPLRQSIPNEEVSTNDSVLSGTNNVKAVSGISMMAEEICRDALAMYSDTVHLARDDTAVLEEDVERCTMTNTMTTDPSNKTVGFSVYCDPTIIAEQEAPRVRSISSGNGLHVIYEEKDDKPKEDDQKAEEEEKDSGVIDDNTDSRSLGISQSNNTCDDFNDSIVSGFKMPSRKDIVTSTPAYGAPPVENYFGHPESIEPKSNDEEKLGFQTVSESFKNKMMPRRVEAPKEVAKPEVKDIQNPKDDSISEQFGRQLSTETNEAAIVAGEAEETGIKNRRRSEVIRGDNNPWKEELREKVMKLVSPPTNMHEFQRICPRVQAMKEIEVDGEKFKIQTMIGQGGYAKVYRATNEDDKVVAVKYEVPSCAWEVYICNQMKYRLARGNKEISKKIAELCIMNIMDAYIFTNASLLVNEYHEYGTLLEYANNLKDPNWHLSCFLINQAATIIKEVHDAGIIHGDIKPDNFIITRKIDANWAKDDLLTVDCFVIKLIDWGRAIDMTKLKEREFTGRAGTEGFDCPEMKDGRPWTFQTDYFGFAASVAVLMTGKYASLSGKSLGNYSLKTDIKRRNELRDIVFQMIDNFLNIKSCSELPGWNTTIKSFSEIWDLKFDPIVWRQSVAKFNEACEAAKNNLV